MISLMNLFWFPRRARGNILCAADIFDHSPLRVSPVVLDHCRLLVDPITLDNSQLTPDPIVLDHSRLQVCDD